MIPLCFFANLVYFLVDDVASQMEVFGHDANLTRTLTRTRTRTLTLTRTRTLTLTRTEP